MSSSSTDRDDITVESLTKSKEDLFSEHGLEATALGNAAEKIADEQEAAAEKRPRIVSRKLLLEQAENQGLGDDPHVEALRADVNDMEQELEAEGLTAEAAEAEEQEAAEKVAELEALADMSGGAAGESFQQKAEALRAEHGLSEEPGRYSAEALGHSEAEAEDDESAEAEALASFRDRQATREADENLPDEARNLLMNLKNMRESAKAKGSESLVEKYTERIEALRAEHAENTADARN